MVDGATRASSVATLSHWPQSPTPQWLARDTSAEIVMAYLRARTGGKLSSRRVRSSLADLVAAIDTAEAVTNDHFDEDGVMSVFALVNPDVALELAALVVEAASCGDFGVVTDDRAAQVAFSLAPLARGEGARATSDSYEAVLPLVPELLAHPERFERLWRDEFASLEAGRVALSAGAVVLEPAPGDVCVVRRTDSSTDRLPGAEGCCPISVVAVNSATPASRILAFDGDMCELTLRYEGWVRVVSRAVPFRPDLAPLAARLTEIEPSGVVWEANGVGAIIGRLAPGGEGRTEIAPGDVVSIVSAYLSTALPAWCPFRKGGGYIPESERSNYAPGGVWSLRFPR